MVRLQVNFFVDVCDYDNVKAHMIISFKMDDLDIVDVLSSQLVVPLASWNEAMPKIKSDTFGDQDPNSRIERPTTDKELNNLFVILPKIFSS